MNLDYCKVQEAASRISNAANVKCPESHILAITKIETPPPHTGDLRQGMPIILNERHWFYKLSGSYPVSQKYPTLSQRNWGGYCTGRNNTARQECEHARLDQKLSIYGGDLESAAYQSISMGLFQVMGFHYKLLGYSHPREMWQDALKMDDTIDLRWAVDFIIDKGLARPLAKGHNSFFDGYNGPGWRQNNYGEKFDKYVLEFEKKIHSCEPKPQTPVLPEFFDIDPLDPVLSPNGEEFMLPYFDKSLLKSTR